MRKEKKILLEHFCKGSLTPDEGSPVHYTAVHMYSSMQA